MLRVIIHNNNPQREYETDEVKTKSTEEIIRTNESIY